MATAPMYGYRPTAEQAERIRQATAAASLVNPERAEQLKVFELMASHTGEGIPEESMRHLINAVLEHKEAPRIDGLLEGLFGRLPDAIFEELGQLAAIRL